nr:SusC/RagA family TonB-linked outer membrane protein [uncultured Carboxylicivirga sp.]
MYNNNISARRIFSLLLIILVSIGFTYAQEESVVSSPGTGLVIDSYGSPVADVVVQIKQTGQQDTTNVSGLFDLKLESGQVLVFQHDNFYIREKKLTAKDLTEGVISVSLTEKYLRDPHELDVVYGTVEKDGFVGASSTIYTDQIASPLANTIVNSFAGRLAGLNISQYQGFKSPNTSSNFVSVIGGNAPVTGNSAPSDNTMFSINSRGMAPVVVVDGIQRELFSLDPENIESVSIQRDALSSMFLGMRSSRGVLLVTTKKPQSGKSRLSFTGRYGIQSTIKTPKPLPAYKYAYLLNEALQNNGKTPAYSYEDFESYRNGSDPIAHPDVNWYDEVMEDYAPIQSYNLNVAGGGAVARYFVSVGYFNQEGFFKTSEQNSYETNLTLDRYQINSKIEVDVTEDLNIGVTVIGRVEEGNQPGAGYSTILRALYNTPNNAYPIYNPNGSYGGNISFYNNIMSQTINSGYIKDETRDIIASLNLTYDLKRFVEGLSFEAFSNLSAQNASAVVRDKQSLVYEYIAGEEGEDGRYDPFGVLSPQINSFVAVQSSRYWYGQVGFDYKKAFGKHKLDASIHADQHVVTLNYDLPQQPANIAFRGRYNYDNKYFAEAAVTESYYNRYIPGNQWGTFYAVGLGWDISKENFLSEATWLDQLKLRAVYGKTGNGIDNSSYYGWRSTYTTTIFDYSYPQGINHGLGEANIDNALANTNLTWEKGDKINVGTDISLFGDRLQLSADYYRDFYYDLLQIRGRSVELMGMSYPAENIGEKLYYGGELSLTYQNNWGDFNYFITANWGQNASELVFIDEQYRQEEYNKVTGKPAGAIFGLQADGLFNSVEEIQSSPVIEGYDIQPGDIKYKDLNNDGVIDQFDMTMIGGDKPTSYYGITLGFNYKGFDFNVLFQGAYNRDLYMGDDVLMAGFQGVGQGYGQAYSHMQDRWTPETAATATYPRLTAGGNTYNMNPNGWWTSFWIRSGNYLRLKDLYLGYTLPESLSHRYLGGTRIKFFVSGQNLLTKADFDLVDPEVSFVNYPLQRVLSTGVNIKF